MKWINFHHNTLTYQINRLWTICSSKTQTKCRSTNSLNNKLKKKKVSVPLLIRMSENPRWKGITYLFKTIFFIFSIIKIVERQWLWAFPQIEGVPPTPRGGHSATLTGASLVIFGVSILSELLKKSCNFLIVNICVFRVISMKDNRVASSISMTLMCLTLTHQDGSNQRSQELHHPLDMVIHQCLQVQE